MARTKNNAPAGVPQLLQDWRFDEPRKKIDLAKLDPAAKPFSSGDKALDKQQVEQLAIDLDACQNLLWANKRPRLLVVLQGIDTSGKDGTLRAVCGRMSPLGVRTTAWKAPNETERSHDFLWRIHRQMPAAGEIMVFNRSHYEDVLVPVVNGTLEGADIARRYAQINDFERLQHETGTVVLKFMLHISRQEQRARLQARIDDPTKRWKFQREDLDVRTLWDAYQQAYARAIAATSTPNAPWIIVPADSKTHRNLMVASVIKHTLQSLKLEYPDQPDIAGLKIS
ncbi:polyphosphate--nucleotide phosphotransferase [Ramlibacter sp. G-1-2-2]|uniref:Polyphosphate--nucleotide phosphotransferase n=1 Tax=Ramlibacter agri TaxID=2728837 RepID=A0A848H0M8_9BURK|nr:PPK2 family polyphosphate kinase [Ramlibacter agri]NML42650.1 polyphosphate--nucleotide phosphotransferase [Ramlibacter agri]